MILNRKIIYIYIYTHLWDIKNCTSHNNLYVAYYMMSLLRREQFVSTLMWTSHIHLIRAQSAYWLLDFVSLCRKRKNGHCLSQCESTRLWSSQTTSFTSLLVERPASKMREMRLLLCPSSCWKRGREFKKSSIAIRIRCGLTSRGQTVSMRVTRLSNFCIHAYIYIYIHIYIYIFPPCGAETQCVRSFSR